MCLSGVSVVAVSHIQRAHKDNVDCPYVLVGHIYSCQGHEFNFVSFNLFCVNYVNYMIRICQLVSLKQQIEIH